jgi:hypothetical protein
VAHRQAMGRRAHWLRQDLGLLTIWRAAVGREHVTSGRCQCVARLPPAPREAPFVEGRRTGVRLRSHPCRGRYPRCRRRVGRRAPGHLRGDRRRSTPEALSATQGWGWRAARLWGTYKIPMPVVVAIPARGAIRRIYVHELLRNPGEDAATLFGDALAAFEVQLES